MSRINNAKKNWTLYIGIIAMFMLIIGVASEAGSLFQKILFLISALVLGIVAYADKQKMLVSLQIVLIFGASLAFFEMVPDYIKYLVLLGVTVLCVGYLIRSRYYETDIWGLVGTVGLFLIAIGYSTNATVYPFWFNALLACGSLLVALYSLVQFGYYKIKIAVIWFVLNVIFSINPFLVMTQLYGA